MNPVRFAGFASLVLVLLVARGVDAQERPRYGGELVYVVPTEPASYDAHREGTFALIHPLAPIYSTLLRFDPTDRTGTKVVGDIAESWTIAKDGRTYTFKLRRGVKFHDGSDLTSKDVKATYDKIVNPPADVVSFRKGQYTAIEVVEAPDPTTVVFRLKWPAASLITALASPFNWIYKADILAKDMHWYETHVMGSGAFVFVEHARGAYWAGKKNPNYWDKGKPYLDSYRALVVKDPNAQVAAVRAERAHVQVPGTPYATPPAELEKLAGYSRDVAKSRAEAKRLLKEAGVPENFSFSLKNRNVPMPYEPVAIWLVDQWRQIGLQARHDFIESTKWEADLRDGNYEVAVDTQCSYAVDPDLDLYKFQSMGISGNNYGRYVDKTLDDLYQKQSRALDAEERRKYVRDFEPRLLDEEAHYAYTLQWHRIIPHSAKLRGWTVPPRHFVNNQLDGV